MQIPLNSNSTIVYDKLSKNTVAENYCKTLETMYTDVISVPMFNDADTLIEDWGIEFFHKETQQEIAWTIITCMMTFINNTGHQVSHVLTNDDFKFYAEVQERLCLGLPSTLMRDELNMPKIMEVPDES